MITEISELNLYEDNNIRLSQVYKFFAEEINEHGGEWKCSSFSELPIQIYGYGYSGRTLHRDVSKLVALGLLIKRGNRKPTYLLPDRTLKNKHL